MAGMSGMGPEVYFGPRYPKGWEGVEVTYSQQAGAPPRSCPPLASFPTSRRINQLSSPIDEGNTKKYISAGLRFVSVAAEHLLTYPFVVLRRQCQVHHCSRYYHLLPFSFVPVIVRLHQRQGISCLWKGIGSVLIVRGITLFVEDVLSKLTPLPKEVTWNSSLKTWGQHILLKCISLAIVTPLYSASLVETVQSKIASDDPSPLALFVEAFDRFLAWGCPYKGRMLPFWALVVPTVLFGAIKHYFSMVVREVAIRIIHLNQKIEQRKRSSLSNELPAEQSVQDIEVTASVIALISSDAVFYPLETIIHRIHLQGTRTIIDNLDNGFAVIPILTNYGGVFDCYATTVSEEGTLGLYKGFGALIFQFMTHWAILKVSKFVMINIADAFAPPLPPLPLKTPSKQPPAPCGDFEPVPSTSGCQSLRPPRSTTEGYRLLS
nr:PREDICTED: solute carrier family 25 member 46-like [Bemisia tabaci]